jgi:hypothetical protein
VRNVGVAALREARGGLTTGGGGGGGGSDVEGPEEEALEPRDAQPDRLKPVADSTGAETLAQPAFLKLLDCASEGSDASAGAGVCAGGTIAGVVVGFAIFIPAALAILRSSFSSRLRSFSLRLSTSSWVVIRVLVCISLRRALW